VRCYSETTGELQWNINSHSQAVYQKVSFSMTLSGSDFEVTAFIESWSRMAHMGPGIPLRIGLSTPSLTYTRRGDLSLSVELLECFIWGLVKKYFAAHVTHSYRLIFDCERRNRMACARRSQIFLHRSLEWMKFTVHGGTQIQIFLLLLSSVCLVKRF